ncbi:Mobile element protein [Azospirillum argentinense]
MQAALEDLGQGGIDVRPELARHVAPLGWEHIGLTGDHVWGADPMPTEGLRPLRWPMSLLAA